MTAIFFISLSLLLCLFLAACMVDNVNYKKENRRLEHEVHVMEALCASPPEGATD